MSSFLSMSYQELQNLSLPEIYRLVKADPEARPFEIKQRIFKRYNAACRLLELEKIHIHSPCTLPYAFVEALSLCLQHQWVVPDWAAASFLSAETNLKAAYEHVSPAKGKREYSWDAHLPKPWEVKKGKKRVLDTDDVNHEILNYATLLCTPKGSRERANLEQAMRENKGLKLELDDYSLSTDLGRSAIAETLSDTTFRTLCGLEKRVVTANMVRTAYEWGLKTEFLAYYQGKKTADLTPLHALCVSSSLGK